MSNGNLNKQPTDPMAVFHEEKNKKIASYAQDKDWHALSNQWIIRAGEQRYTYNFTSLGIPIIQLPQDMVAMQEVIWQVRPDLIVEMGVAHGGSLVLSASMLAMLDYCDAVAAGETLDPKKTRRKVLGVDIDIRAHNRAAITSHPLAHHIDLIQGSSIEAATITQVKEYAAGFSNVLVVLDSNHTHDHVLAELQAYAPLASVGSYCVVFDTVIEDVPDSLFPDRPWGKGNNPKTAVWEYLKTHPEFEIDKALENKLMFTVAPDGYLKRLR